MNLSATTQPTSRTEQSEDYSGDGTTLHLPTSTQPDQSWYWGARVSVDSPGINTHVVYPDLSSMYPNLLRTLNISPDTIIGTADDLYESEYDESDCVWAYIDTREVKRCGPDESWQDFTDGQYKAVQRKKDGSWKTPDGGKCDPPQYEQCYFLRPDIKQGFITELIDEFMVLKDKHDGTHLYDSTKAVINSLYGVLGYATEHNAFRLFDHRLAEGVTLAGRLVLEKTIDGVIEYAEREYDTEAYLTHSDTDGAGISLDVDSREKALTIAHDATEYLRDVGYGKFLKDRCGYTDDLLDYHSLSADVEYYAPRIYNHDKKKRYALRRTWDEGEEDDSIKITGFEAIRSDVSQVTVDVQTEVFDLILRGSQRETTTGLSSASSTDDNLRNELHDVKDEVYEYISDAITAVENGEVPIEDLGVRNGIGQELSEYGSANRRPQPVYRASKYVNEHVGGEDLGEASKPMCWPIDRIVDDELPQTYSADTAEDGTVVEHIAAEDPTNVEDLVAFDYETIAHKQVIDRVRPIISNINEYEWDELMLGHASTSLDQFM